MNRWAPWRETDRGNSLVAKAVCFIAGHDTEERFTFGGRGTRECLRCRKRWECWLSPYSRGTSH